MYLSTKKNNVLDIRTEWFNCTLGCESLLDIYGLIANKNIKVKYINRQDFDNLEFTPKFTTRKVLYGDTVDTYQRGHGKLIYRINYWWNDYKCVIELHNEDIHELNDFVQIFNGIIKNISEFRKLLKQLNIWVN